MKKVSRKYQDFTEMPIWQLAMQIAEDIFLLTKRLPREEDYGLTSQLRRAALSMSSNIAEGFGRSGIRDKCKFYEYAKSSGFEVRNDLIYGWRVGYFKPCEQQEVSEKILKFTHEINKLLKALRNGKQG